MTSTTNYEKHVSNNLIQRFLLDNFNRRLLELVRLTNADSVLDAGCGEGFTLNLLKKNKLGNKIEGVDYSDDALKLANQINPDLKITKESIYELPFNDNSYDLVICSEVLEHLESPEKAIDEIVRVSKKHIIISVPNEPFFMLANFLRGKYFTRFGNHPEHINHWTSNGITKLMTKHKIKVSKIYTPFAWSIIHGTKI